MDFRTEIYEKCCTIGDTDFACLIDYLVEQVVAEQKDMRTNMYVDLRRYLF